MAPKGDVLLAALSLLSLAFPPAARGRAEPVVKIDPRMLVELATVRGVVSSKDNPVWPSWNAADTPVLIYLPGVQDVLIDHPKPPEGFVKVSPQPPLPGWDVRVKDGETLIGWDGQNTSREVGGVSTLVLCDTPSTLKQKLRGILEDPRPAETKLADLDYERDLVPDVYGQLATIVHEGFHVFQTRSAEGKGADERDVRLYPCLSVDNNVDFALEGVALAECMRAADPAEARAAAVRWLAVRGRRRAGLPSPAVRYEDGNEYMEGLAVYSELALMRALEGRAPDPRLYAYQGFHGFADLSFYRERRIGELLGSTNGTVNVNNDRYGTSPVRHRLYFTGMAIASLLDRFLPGWKTRIFAADVSLTDLARQALHPTEAERKAALAQADRSASLDSLRRAKLLLAQEGLRDLDSLRASVLEAPAGTVVIDYSALDTRKIGLSFTGYGVRALDTLRTIYTLVPIAARIGSSRYGFEQSQPLPTLEDRGTRRFAFPLARALTKAERVELTRLTGGPGDSLDARLPGVRLFARRAAVETAGRTIRIRYLPARDAAPTAAGSASSPAVAAAPTDSVPLFVLVREGARLALRTVRIGPNETKVFERGGSSEVIDVLLPVGPGRAGNLVSLEGRGTIVVRRAGDELRLEARTGERVTSLPPRRIADLRNEDVRVSVLLGETRAAFEVRGWAEAAPDTIGPVEDLFAGQLPAALRAGNAVITTDTRRRDAARAAFGAADLKVDRYLRAKARLGGAPGEAILDLGAVSTTVTRDVLPPNARLEPATMVEYSAAGRRELEGGGEGATGAVKTLGTARLDSLRMGGLLFRDVEVSVVDRLPSGLGPEVRAIVGMDLLKSARVRIDFQGDAGLLTLSDPAGAAAADGMRVPFSVVHELICARAETRGQPLRLLLDTGAPETFLDSLAARALGVSRTLRGSMVQGLDGTGAASRVARLPELTLGPWRTSDVPCRIASLSVLRTLSREGQPVGLLGLSTLTRLRGIEIDFPRRVLTLRS